jgi:DNA repair exonuclease SbcCD ATPase subunit
MEHVLTTELEAKDEIIAELKQVAKEAVATMEDEVQAMQNEKKELEALRVTIEETEKNLGNSKRLEKEKRFKMEERIRKRFQKEGAVVLESGALMATPHQLQVDLEVRSQLLLSTIESEQKKSQELDSAKKELEKAVGTAEKEKKKRGAQLRAFRRTQKTRLQKQSRAHATNMKSETSRYHPLTFFSVSLSRVTSLPDLHLTQHRTHQLFRETHRSAGRGKSPLRRRP